jgi:hypothetical protein
MMMVKIPTMIIIAANKCMCCIRGGDDDDDDRDAQQDTDAHTIGYVREQ